ncbi:hypothetical protein SOM16_07160 [Pedobacter sp. CFBP9032]|nr:hypothetical protein [Pedobacter sp. CFBP9032]
MFEAILTKRMNEETRLAELESEFILESLRIMQDLKNTVRQIDPNMATPFSHQHQQGLITRALSYKTHLMAFRQKHRLLRPGKNC